MPRFAANLSLMFTEVPFLDRFEAAARAGFKGVEFLFPYPFPTEDLVARIDKHGLEVVLFNLPPGHWDEGERGITALRNREAEFSVGLDLALRYAEALGCKRLHAMAGLAHHDADHDVYRKNLKLAADWARDLGITILIEPINTADVPGYFLSSCKDTESILNDVEAPNLGLQFDFYHCYRQERSLLESLRIYAHITRHYQCAHPLDRSEPTQEPLNYQEVFQTLDTMGFDGWVGCEYKPKKGTVEGLDWFAPWREAQW